MAAPKVYKSTDANAPVLNGLAGSLIGLLDAVLLNGYGGKTPLGWTKEFSGINKAAYRPGAAMGNRLFYRFDNSNPLGGTYTKFSSRMFESMSDVDTGAGASAIRNAFVSGSINATARDWIIIGDSYGFHLCIYPLYNTWPYWDYNYYGEGLRLSPVDGWFSVMSGNDSAGTLTNFSNFLLLINPDSTINAMNTARKGSGVAGYSYAAFKYSGSAKTAMIGQKNLPWAYPKDGFLHYTHPVVDDGAANTLRGYIPGLYAPEHGSGLTHGEIYPDGARQLMAITTIALGYPDNANKQGAVLIDIGEGYRP